MIHVYTVRNSYPCRSVVNCSSEMVLSIRYSTIKKTRSGPYWISRNKYNFFCFNSSLSTEGTSCFLYISHNSVTDINPFHDGPVAEKRTEQVNWYFSSAVVSSWKGLTFIIRVFFPRYSVEHIFKRFNMPNINIYLECISFLKLYTRESLQSALLYMSQWSVEINYGTNR